MLSTVVYGGNQPSSWATAEVTAADQEGMIPESLLSDYQTNIKRYEYVLIALKLLEKDGIVFKENADNPFTDTINHPYEEEITKAYYAGIIKGDGKGSFRPDESITRQEIASLVVNVVKVLDPNRILDDKLRTVYSDREDISSWAEAYINYCYNSGIMNGVGKDDKGRDEILPKGTATREQAILLLHRLANKYKLFVDYDLGDIQVVDTANSMNERTYTSSGILNDFAKTFNKELAVKIQNLSESGTISVLYMEADQTQLLIEDKASVSIVSLNQTLDFSLRLRDLSNTDAIDIYLDLIQLIEPSELLKNVIDRDIQMFTSDNPVSSELPLEEGSIYLSEMYQIDDDNVYSFTYRVNH